MHTPVYIRNGHTGLVTFPNINRSASALARSSLMRDGLPFYTTGLPYPTKTYANTCLVLETKDKLIVSVRIVWY